jgi:hypothetical protein
MLDNFSVFLSHMPAFRLWLLFFAAIAIQLVLVHIPHLFVEVLTLQWAVVVVMMVDVVGVVMGVAVAVNGVVFPRVTLACIYSLR